MRKKRAKSRQPPLLEQIKMADSALVNRRMGEDVLFFGILVGLSLLAGMAFRLKLPAQALLCVGVALLAPGILHSRWKQGREIRRFRDVDIYIEQMLYAFQAEKKILHALSSVSMLFDRGPMKSLLEEAIRRIRSREDPGNAEYAGLDGIRQCYPCSRVDALHAFMLQAEELGGDFAGSVRLLQEDRRMWSRRVDLLLQKRRKYLRDTVISIGMSMGICLAGLYMLPADVNLAGFWLTQASTVGLILMNLLVLSGVMRRISQSLLEQEREDGRLLKKYWQLQNWSAAREQKKSLLLCMLPAILCTAAAYTGAAKAAVLAGAAAGLMALQHRIGYALLKKTVRAGIRRAFPEWLMQMALLLQTENVQVAIARSIPQAPAILQHPLQELRRQIEEEPESGRPYVAFLDSCAIPESASAMRMLYTLSAGTGGDPAGQIREIISRNQALYDRSQRQADEDGLAGVYALFLLPAVVGMLKLAVDMMTFMLLYFGNMGTMG